MPKNVLIILGMAFLAVSNSFSPTPAQAQDSSAVQDTTRSLIAPPPPPPEPIDPDAKGSISGKVIDREGNPMAGVLVTVAAKGMEGSLVTEASGRFRFQGLPPGVPFNVGFAKRGFLMETRDNVTLRAGQDVVIELQLRQTKVKSLKPITVVAAPPKGSPFARKYISAEELSKVKTPNLLDALNRVRPSMLVKHISAGMCIDSVFSLYVDGIRRPLFEPEYTEFDSTQARMRSVPISQVVFERELEWLRPDEVAQVTYVSCDDYVPGIPRRNLIWVITKRALAGAASVKEEKQR